MTGALGFDIWPQFVDFRALGLRGPGFEARVERLGVQEVKVEGLGFKV